VSWGGGGWENEGERKGRDEENKGLSSGCLKNENPSKY
jgi:hypothetical protein